MDYSFQFGAVFAARDALLAGAWLTIRLSVACMGAGLLLGTACAVAATFGGRVPAALVRGYVEVIRNTPFLIQLFIIYFGLASVGIRLPPVPAAVVGFGLNGGAYLAEVFRAGIEAVNRGQSEAAFALGLRPGRTMSLIVLPQALRVIIPPLISQYLNLMKNSSLAIAVGYMDLRGTLGGTTLNQTGREMECMVLLMGVYLILSLIISGGMNVLNARVSLKER